MHVRGWIWGKRRRERGGGGGAEDGHVDMGDVHGLLECHGCG